MSKVLPGRRTIKHSWRMFALSAIFSFFALALLRVFQVRLLQLGAADAFRVGLGAGLFSDASLALLPLGLAWALSSVMPRLAKPVQLIASFSLWIIATANVCYFIFFQSQLNLWVASSYSGNVWSVRSAVVQLLDRPWIFVSAAVWLLSVVLLLAPVSGRGERRFYSSPSRLAAGSLVIVLALLVRQSPVWFRIPRVSESILSDNIAWKWYDTWASGGMKTRLPVDHYRQILPDAPQDLAEYSSMSGDRFGGLRMSKHKIEEHQVTEKLRALLGFPPHKRLNVVVVFLESGRAFELLNDTLGNEIYPRLRKVFKEHGIFFRQTYSTANYTVQGQFSTLCSGMDRVDSVSVYSGQPYLKVDCLPSVFARNGYSTYWMNAYDRYFEGKYVFESNHGTQHFLDRDFFRAHTPEEAVNGTEWGVSDKVFLSQALDKLNSLHESGKPFFAHLLTTGTHSPWKVLRGYELSDSLKNRVKADATYMGYLSSAKALDEALGEFFERFFESPVSDDTVVAVLADHGTGVTPTGFKLSQLQKELIWPRIIFGVVSKKAHPKVVSYPVHQMDVAPLLASIAGVHRSARWLGREPILDREGTPWVKRTGSTVSYRTQDRICAKLRAGKPLSCWAFGPLADPMFGNAPVVKEDPQETRKFVSVIEANEAVLEFGGKSGSERRID